MLDHLSWYLVELEQRLRGRRSGEATTNFLLETRSHLEEHADDLVSRGVDRATAVKSAIADFGSPAYVAGGFIGRRPMSRKMYWFLIAVVALIGSLMVPALIVASNGVAGVFDPVSRLDFFYTPLFGLIAVAALAYRTRRWVAPAVCVFVTGFTLAALSFFAANTREVRIHGNSRLVYAPSMPKEIVLRSQWLASYSVDTPKLQHMLQRPAGATLDAIVQSEMKVEGEGYLVPTKAFASYYRFITNRSLISSYNQPRAGWYPLEYGNHAGFILSTVPDLKSAVKMWDEQGAEYSAFLKQRAADLRSEVAALSAPLDTKMAQRWQELCVVPLATIGMFFLVAVAVNGLTLLLRDAVDRWRRYSWRRQLG